MLKGLARKVHLPKGAERAIHLTSKGITSELPGASLVVQLTLRRVMQFAKPHVRTSYD